MFAYYTETFFVCTCYMCTETRVINVQGYSYSMCIYVCYICRHMKKLKQVICVHTCLALCLYICAVKCVNMCRNSYYFCIYMQIYVYVYEKTRVTCVYTCIGLFHESTGRFCANIHIYTQRFCANIHIHTQYTHPHR